MKFTAATIITAAALSSTAHSVYARINDVNSRRNLKKPDKGKEELTPCEPGDVICIAQYEPVCGDDNKDYTNAACLCPGVTKACDGKCPCTNDGGSTGTTTTIEVGTPCDSTSIEPCGSTNLQCIYSTCLCDTLTNEGCSETQVCHPVRGVGNQCFECDCGNGQKCGHNCGDDTPKCYPKKEKICKVLTPGLI